MADDGEIRDAVFDGFLLGIRAFSYAHDIDVPGTEDYKLWDVLREVADGELCLSDTPAEKAMKFPNTSEEMKEYLARNMNAFIRKDRRNAARVLKAMGDLP